MLYQLSYEINNILKSYPEPRALPIENRMLCQLSYEIYLPKGVPFKWSAKIKVSGYPSKKYLANYHMVNGFCQSVA
jgi:hypothetical protein